MLKTGLGRGLGELMNGQGEPEKAKIESSPFAGAGKAAVSPGLGAYLRPGSAGDAAASAQRKPAPVVVAKPSDGLLALSLWIADAVLIILTGCLLWSGGASFATLLLASFAMLLAAWCGSLACWVAFANTDK